MFQKGSQKCSKCLFRQSILFSQGEIKLNANVHKIKSYVYHRNKRVLGLQSSVLAIASITTSFILTTNISYIPTVFVETVDAAVIPKALWEQPFPQSLWGWHGIL